MQSISWEAENNVVKWFARVPTEANIAAFLSRFQKVYILCYDLFCNGPENIFGSMLCDTDAGMPQGQKGCIEVASPMQEKRNDFDSCGLNDK